MNTKTRYALILSLALLVAAALAAVAWAAPQFAPLAGGAPELVAYQGEVRVGGVPYDGDGYFKFAVVRSPGLTTTAWSNDGTSVAGGQPGAAVALPVDDGLFSVLLGDTTLGGMTQPLAAVVFSASDRYLRVWFSTGPGGPFEQLGPDTRIAAVPYALQAQEALNADTVDGLHADDLRTRYANVIVVAKSGADYTSVQVAIDHIASIGDAAAGNAYLVWVAPGVYEEQVTMIPYVHLQGAGQKATVITSDANSGVWPPTTATVVLASDTSLRDLTVENSGVADGNEALLAAGTERTTVADVTARSVEAGSANHAITVIGASSLVTLERVAAEAENATSSSRGLIVTTNAEAVLRGGSFTARGGTQAVAITSQINSTLTVYDVTALAENGTENFGLGNYEDSSMMVRGATVTARGGSRSYAVDTRGNSSTLDAEGVVALAEGASAENLGLYVGAGGVHTTVRGGSFTGRGGDDAGGIGIDGSDIVLYAEGVTALGENGSSQISGLINEGGAQVTLSGGSFTGRGVVSDTYGISNSGAGTTLAAESVTALAEEGENNYGLFNGSGAIATLSGGSFTGRRGDRAHGIGNRGSGTSLQAESITALGEDGSAQNSGLFNRDSALAVLRGGFLVGRGGGYAIGIHNDDGTLDTENVSALAEGDNTTIGLYQSNGNTAADSSHFSGGAGLKADGGTLYIGVSQLDGGVVDLGAVIKCFQVYDSSYNAYTCP